MSLIQISHLTFGYDGSCDTIFDDVSLQLDTNWKLGFVGRNGRGKTTFLKLLLGQYEYRGSISTSVAFDYFPFEVAQKQRNAVEILQDLAPKCQYWQLQRELSLLDVEEEALWRPFSQLSSGEQTKMLLAALFLRENHFLLIDEPTNHLDMPGRKIVSRYLKKKRGFLLVSHDRQFLDDVVDHILSINRKSITIERGNFSSWQENKQKQYAFEQSEHKKLIKQIHSLETAAKTTANWSNQVEKTKVGYQDSSGNKPDRGYIGHKSAKMMKRSKTIENRIKNAIAEKESLRKDVEKEESLKLFPLSYHKEVLLELRQAALRYGEIEVFQKLSFSVKRGERVALQGGNGTGKSSILKWIAGKEIPLTGQTEKGSGLIISYVNQDTSHLNGTLKEYAQNEGICYSLFLAILRKLGFERGQFDKKMQYFSQGQKKKVLLAKSLCQKAHIYVWDEPLNFIDVISRMQIEELLLQYQPTMLFVEHDAVFTKKIATKFVSL